MSALNPRIIMVCGVALIGASPFLASFLGKWESGPKRVLTVYADKLAGGLPTVCNGLTRHVTATPIIVGETWTDAQCEAEEETAIIAVQTQLARCFKRPVSQMVFDVATSHAWNNGVAATCGSLAMKAWNDGNTALGCQRMARSDAGRPVWSYTCTIISGVRECTFVQGLANRREDEAANCMASL